MKPICMVGVLNTQQIIGALVEWLQQTEFKELLVEGNEREFTIKEVQ